MIDEELQAIMDRVRKATPGPWLSDEQVNAWVGSRRNVGVWVRYHQRNETLNPIVFVDARRVGHASGSVAPLDDASFIAHAREDVTTLLREVARLKLELATCAERADGPQEKDTP